MGRRGSLRVGRAARGRPGSQPVRRERGGAAPRQDQRLAGSPRGDVRPISKLPVKEISQPLRGPRKLRLLLLGMCAGVPWGMQKREFCPCWGLRRPSGSGNKCQVLSERWDSFSSGLLL